MLFELLGADSEEPLPFIHQDHRWYCSTGGFYRLYGELGQTSYLELFDADPIELGYIVVHANDGQVEHCEAVII
jgi:hypothetical protein